MKLNYKRTICVGFAFFLICAFWQAYDNTIPLILTNKFGMSQAWSGVIMALDNILALFLLPLFAGSLIHQPPASWGGTSVWLSLLGLGLLCTAFAYILYFRLLTSIGPVKSMTVTFMIPPFGVLWGALFLDEPLSMAHVYGGLLIAVALWLVLRPGRP